MDILSPLPDAFTILIIVWTLIASAIGMLIREQIKASIPQLASWIAQRAASRLPLELKSRYEEEWLAVIHHTPGPLLKLTTAIGFRFAIQGIAREFRREQLAKTQIRDQPIELTGKEKKVARRIEKVLGRLPPDRAKLAIQVAQALVEIDLSELNPEERRELIKKTHARLDPRRSQLRKINK